jgi:transcriptional regulator with XRE-family HTH domain
MDPMPSTVAEAAAELRAARERMGKRFSTAKIAARTNQLARAHGVPIALSQQQISQLENEVPKKVPPWFHYVRLVLAEEEPVALSEVRGAELPRADRRHKPIPIVGSAIGDGREMAELEEHIELTELYLSEIHGHIERSPNLAADSQAYALTIMGNSMSPRFEPGNTVVVSPRLPVNVGDDVIVQLNAGRDSDRVALVLVKRFLRRTASGIELRQFNPDKIFHVPMARIVMRDFKPAIHRIAEVRF